MKYQNQAETFDDTVAERDTNKPLSFEHRVHERQVSVHRVLLCSREARQKSLECAAALAMLVLTVSPALASSYGIYVCWNTSANFPIIRYLLAKCMALLPAGYIRMACPRTTSSPSSPTAWLCSP
jgi:hypothetical protein